MISEATIASAAADWLRDTGWEPYFEVSIAWKLRRDCELGDARADIVATRGGLLCVVECKQTLSFDLLAQAKRWRGYADLVWIAVPRAKRSEGRSEALRVASKFYGLGVLEFDETIVRERYVPKLVTREHETLLDSLAPEHKTNAAPGTNRGGQWTSFRATADAIAKFVAANGPSCTLLEAVDATPHHYRSKAIAVASLAKAVRKGLVPGVKVGWKQRLYPVDAPVEGNAQS